MTKKQKKLLCRIILSLVLLLATEFIPAVGAAKLILYLIPYLIIGFDILANALYGIKNLQPFDENFLMAVATVGAMCLGEYTEGVAVMLFYQTGELFQSIAVGKSRKNISSLMDIRPDRAFILTDDGEICEAEPDEVEIGSTIIVRPGEKVPIDGVITEGSTSLDTSALTGESVPRTAKTGDEILGGIINLSGLIKVRTTKEFGDSTVSKILELVENASSRKSKSEKFITKFARYYTPVVCLSALALAIIPSFIGLYSGNAEWSKWIYRALTFLVISCPCALVISIPLSFFAGIGGASGQGILIKGSNYMETLSRAKYAVFDKTGTLTKGVFDVIEIKAFGISEDYLLEYTSHAECFSTHPIADSIRRKYGKQTDSGRVSDIKEESGKGIRATVDGVPVLVGKAEFLIEAGISTQDVDAGAAAVHVAISGIYRGYILISDVMKETSAKAVEKLKKSGVAKVIMLTGDGEGAAMKIASQAGIDEVFFGLLPDGKVEKVEELIASKKQGEKLIFVGDGINDAPVLSRADVGIAMGGIGSDAAIEASDVVLMDDNPEKVAKAIRIAKKCMGIVYQNIIFAIGIKLLCLILVSAGHAGMWFGIFADVGVMVIAVLNAIRTLYVKNL